MQPITHYSIALLINKGLQAVGVPVNRKGFFWGSVLPDMDYVLAPQFSRFLAHRTVTHTPFWTALTAAVMRRRWGFWSTWLGGLVHLATDELTSCNRRTGRRSRLMWLFPWDLGRRPWRRCLFDMGRLPGHPVLGTLLIEGSIITAAFLVARRNPYSPGRLSQDGMEPGASRPRRQNL